MSGLAVTGHASLDYPVVLAGPAIDNRTTLIEQRDDKAWPRLGGCAYYVATEVASAGLSATPITWVGANREGEFYKSGLADGGMETGGCEAIEGCRTPVALMVYQKTGDCACLYDRSLNGREQLTDAQASIISHADDLCITVGPPGLIEPALDARKPGARVTWVMKNDPNCFSPKITEVLAGKASIIFCNRGERELLPRHITGDVVIVMTCGSNPVLVERAGQQTEVPVVPVTVGDYTGAGDTLAGGTIAALMAGVTDPATAVAAGVAATRRLLDGRVSSKEDNR